MKKLFFLLVLTVFNFKVLSAQRFFSKDARVNFNATTQTSPEKIEGANPKGVCVIDATTGAIEFVVLVKNFHFESALMEEHFNENYMETDKFAKSNFVGSITDIKTVNLKKDGSYNVNVAGKLTIHGITKDVTTKAVISVANGGLSSAKAAFGVKLSDFGISIPSAVSDKVSTNAKIEINAALAIYK